MVSLVSVSNLPRNGVILPSEAGSAENRRAALGTFSPGTNRKTPQILDTMAVDYSAERLILFRRSGPVNGCEATTALYIRPNPAAPRTP